MTDTFTATLVQPQLTATIITAGPPGPQGPPGASNAIYTKTWAWSSNTATPPSTGQIRTNTGVPSTATMLYLHERADDNVDVTAFMAGVKVNDDIRIQQKTDSANWARYNITGLPIDQGTYFAITVALLEAEGSVPNNNAAVEVSFLTEGVSAAQWYTGPSAPTSVIGRIGDMYLEGDGDVWKSVEPTGWVQSTTNIKGAAGAPGPAGTVAAAGPGTAALPSISFAGDPNTGFWNQSPDQIAVSTGGVASWIFGSSGALSTIIDNAFDIGQSSNYRPRNLYLAGTINPGATTTVTALQVGSGTASSPSLAFSLYPTTGFYAQSSNQIGVVTNGVGRWVFDITGHFLALLDNTVDIGSSVGYRPRTIYAGTSVVTPLVTTPNVVSVGSLTLEAGSGQTLLLRANSTDRWAVNGGNGSFYATTDNTVDIGYGAGTLRPRTIYAGTSVVTPLVDTSLLSPAGNVVEQRNSTSQQTLRIYRTYTDAGNYERLLISPAAPMTIAVEAAGTGVARDLTISGGNNLLLQSGTAHVDVYPGGALTWRFHSAGLLLSPTDNVNDIGQAGAQRPRSIYAGTSVVTPALRVTSPGAFAAGDKYLVVDASGNVHKSALGPAS